MGRLSDELARIVEGTVALLRRVIFAGVDLEEPTSPFPDGEEMIVLDGESLGGDADRYAAVAGEVMRVVVDISPRHATAIVLHSATLEPPDGMERLAAVSKLDADETPDGRVDATRDTLDAVARLLGPEMLSVTVLDDAERPIVRWEEGARLTVGLPESARKRLEERLPDAATQALRSVEGQA